jgi:hypothetical protein
LLFMREWLRTARTVVLTGKQALRTGAMTW